MISDRWHVAIPHAGGIWFTEESWELWDAVDHRFINGVEGRVFKKPFIMGWSRMKKRAEKSFEQTAIRDTRNDSLKATS